MTEWLNLIAKNYLLISQTAVYKLSFNKYKKISCQDTSFTDTLKIIYPASQTARGHIIKAAFLFSFGRVHHTKLCAICCTCRWKLVDIINLTVTLRSVKLFPTESPNANRLVNALKWNLHLQRKLKQIPTDAQPSKNNFKTKIRGRRKVF